MARVSASIPPGTGPFEPGASPIWPARKTSPFASTTFEKGRLPGSRPGPWGTVFGMIEAPLSADDGRCACRAQGGCRNERGSARLRHDGRADDDRTDEAL